MPYRARVNERTLLDLPGFHAGAFVYVYVEIDSEEARENALHKLDTLVSALRLFREGLVAEFELYDLRERERQPAAA